MLYENNRVGSSETTRETPYRKKFYVARMII
jgi:hypothetical protein